MANQVPQHSKDYLLQDLSRLWTRVAANEGWFRQEWMGVPIWQLPGDLMRLQRLVAQINPKWIVETGTKFGGSAIFFSSLLKLLGREDGGVLTCDIEEQAEARRVFSEHPLRSFVKAYRLGDAADPALVAEIEAQINQAPGPVLVFLDDNHNRDHVLKEMELYSPLVTKESYLVVADTVFEDLADSPVGRPSDKYPDVKTSNPRAALEIFLQDDKRFERDNTFVGPDPSNFPDGFLKRIG